MTHPVGHPLALLAGVGRKALYRHWTLAGPEVSRLSELEHSLDQARKAERYGLDAIFQADFIGLHRADVKREPVPAFDVQHLSAIIAASVPRIAVIPTISVLFNQPYMVARQLASLDHIAPDRLAWNVVTSFNAERNFGFDTLPTAAERYQRAGEFLDVIWKLWQSWPQEANRPDWQTGEYARSDLIRDIHHRGPFYAVEGAIDVPPRGACPPPVIQAGASPDGIDSAIHHADAMFMAAPTLEQGRALSDKVRARARELGRDPASLRFIFGIRATLGDTREEAERRFAEPLSDFEVDAVRTQVEREIEGLSLADIALDAPLPPGLLSGPEATAALQRRRSRIELFQSYAAAPDQTLRGLLTRIARRTSHAYVVGTKAMLAEEMARWHQAGVADGFILGGDLDLDTMGQEVIPLLRQMGVVDAPSSDRTLRATLDIGETQLARSRR